MSARERCGVPNPYRDVVARCVLDAGHAGLHSWNLEIDMESVLPACRLCGGKAARCACPAWDADGRSTVVPCE